MNRPRPPAGLAAGLGPAFTPAPELDAWTRATFIDDGASLQNEEHSHLAAASILWLWATAENLRSGKRILGQARIPRPPATGDRWARAAFAQQIDEWFATHGGEAGDGPDFIVTLYAPYAAECSDLEFCALVEHELLHCAQATDEYDQPKFDEDGRPKWTIRAHDIEEFASVVERYGAATPDIERLRVALSQPPTVGRASIAAACGTCRAA